ncbi:Thymidylate kinase [Actinomadura rubteroloni]|uniref:Thymidylate kinase n=1 Tax=Actinomadura rubteroloni TaxID=1926885 RepID=A0A2P4UNK3_9ACTN|nr:dTMP kinase [Actinomadura rubteroloni]POM26631.1 Thymidylate kinase [Actinomadura rubteroloni]
MTRTGVTRPDPAAPPGDSPNLRRLRTALALSSTGQWLSVGALTAMAGVLARDDAPLDRAPAIGLVLALLLAPAVLLAPLVPAVGRLDRRTVLVAADLVRLVLLVSVPLVDAQVWTAVAALLVGVAALPWTTVVTTTAPALAGADHAERARTAALRTVFGAAPVAGVLFAVLSLVADAVAGAATRADLVLYVTAAVFLASAIAVVTLGDLPRGADRVPSPLGLLLRNGSAAGLAVLGLALAGGAIVAVAQVEAVTLGAGNPGYGSVLAGLALGAAFGAFEGPRVLAVFSRVRLLGLAVPAGALLLLVLALVHNLVVVVFLAGFFGVAAGIAWSAARSVVPDRIGHLRSVALVGALVAVAVLPPVAAAIGTHRLGDDYAFTGAQAILLAGAVLAALLGFVALRRLDDRRGIPLVPDLVAALRGERYTPPLEEASRPLRPAERGVFVAFEGGEGAGKTTQARLAAIWLRDHGYDVVTTHEPGATKIGMRLRAMLLDRDTTGLSPRAETLLYAADRADHVANVILPAMARGAIVVSDRFVDSSLAYQGYGRKQPVEDIAKLNGWATQGLVPDLTVLLMVQPEAGLRRLPAPADRIESEPAEFHERVRDGFLALAETEPDRYLVLDASRPQSELSRQIQDRIREILPDPVPAAAEDVTSTFPAITD